MAMISIIIMTTDMGTGMTTDMGTGMTTDMGTGMTTDMATDPQGRSPAFDC
jgi:hypothetical protein